MKAKFDFCVLSPKLLFWYFKRLACNHLDLNNVTLDK
jgi:hypothetical protein